MGGSDAAVENVDYDPRWPECSTSSPTGASSPSHLRFRDRLREDAGLRTEYADLKRRLVAWFSDDREAYTNAKTEFVRRVEAG